MAKVSTIASRTEPTIAIPSLSRVAGSRMSRSWATSSRIGDRPRLAPMKPVPVDLVMATNRASPYLRLALGAVAAQTYPHWNLTVVDDGTPDPKVVPEFTAGMANTRVLRRPRSGLPASRNAGMAVGRAPLIAFLDDDDVWEPDKLAAQVAALEAEPQAIACFTAGRYIDGEGREFGRGWAAHSVPSELFVSGQEPQPRIVSLMVRRTANEDVGGFNESYSVGEDNEYILRLALHGPMVAVPRPLISYRRHDHNMSSADSLSGRWAARRMLRELTRLHAGTTHGQRSYSTRTARASSGGRR